MRASTLGRTVSAVLLPLLTLAMTGVISMPAAQSAQAAAAASSAVVYEGQAVVTTNKHRTRHHLHVLRADRCLSRFANRQAARMASQHRIFHQYLQPIVRRCGLRHVGENVAVGYSSGKSVVSDGWMHSVGHRRNILTRGFRIVAVGAAQDGAGRWYTAQVLGRR